MSLRYFYINFTISLLSIFWQKRFSNGEIQAYKVQSLIRSDVQKARSKCVSNWPI